MIRSTDLIKSLPFILFFLLNLLSLPHLNQPGVDDYIVIKRNQDILRAKRVSNDNYGLLIAPLPFFWLLGFSTLALRISQVFFLFLTLLAFSKLSLPPPKKIVGLFLLATSPLIIPGRNEANFLPFFALFPLALLEKREARRIFLASLILGFGGAIKLVVLYFALPLLLFFFKNWKEVFIGALGLFLGFSPYLIVEVVTGFPMFNYSLRVVSSGETGAGYQIFNFFPNFVDTLWKFLNSFFLPYDLRPSIEFYNLPLVRLFRLIPPLIYFSLFFFCSFTLLKLKRRTFIVLAFLSFLFLLPFNPSFPKATHFYFLFPVLLFIILEGTDKKHLQFFILLSLLNLAFALFLIDKLPDEKFFPAFGAHKYELLSSLKEFNNSFFVTSLHEIKGFEFLLGDRIITPLKFYSRNLVGIDEEKMEKIEVLMKNKQSLIFIFPSYERKTLKDRFVYRDCYLIDPETYSRKYPCYEIAEVLKKKTEIFGNLSLIKVINDSANLPVYEIFKLEYSN